MKKVSRRFEELYQRLMRRKRWWRCLQFVFIGLVIAYWVASSMLEYLTSMRILMVHAQRLQSVFNTAVGIAVLLLPVFGYLFYRKSYVWEGRRDEKKQAEHAEQVWQTDIGLIWKGAMHEVIMECEALRGDGVAVQRLLMELVRDGKIDSGYGEALMIVYHKLTEPKDCKILETVHCAIKADSGEENRIDSKLQFDRKRLDEMKFAFSCLPQKKIDQLWDEYMQNVAKEADD